MGKYKDRKQSQYNSINVKKWVGISLIILGLIGFIFACITSFVLGKFVVGTLGICAYPIFLLLMLVGLANCMGLSFKGNLKFTVFVVSTILAFLCLLHSIFSVKALNTLSFGAYISSCYNLTYGITIGGVLLGFICDVVGLVFGGVGTCIFFGIVTCVVGGFTVDYAIYNKNEAVLISNKKSKSITEKLDDEKVEQTNPEFIAPKFEGVLAEDEEDFADVATLQENEEQDEASAKSILFGSSIANDNLDGVGIASNEPKSAKEILFGERSIPNIYASTDEERKAWLEAHPYEQKKKTEETTFAPFPNYESMANSRSREIDEDKEMSASEKLFGSSRFNSNNSESIDKTTAMNILGMNKQNDESNDEEEFKPRRRNSAIFEQSMETSSNNDENEIANFTPRSRRNTNFTTDLTVNEDKEDKFVSRRESSFKPRMEQTEIGLTKPSVAPKQSVKDAKYNAPPANIFQEIKEDTSKYAKNYEENARIIQEKLEEFGISARVTNIVRGPTVTRYELTMPSGVSVKKMLNYDSDVAMALRSKAGVRIEAPIPGKNAVGIEVPNDPRSTVTFKELIESPEFATTSTILPVAIGKNVDGEVIVKSLAKMVHVLIAGSTGSGKSVFLHSLIVSLMLKMSPDQLRFIMIDPKRVELSRYKGMPHMMLPDIVGDSARAINSLGWAVKEMKRRFSLFEQYGAQNIGSFNQNNCVKNGEQKQLPYIVIVVDELAQLMETGKKEVEEKIRQLTQLARACGIHLVVATQRPSVDIVTGTIKNNLPTRIAFRLASGRDSMCILDETGAEKLLGNGDMLFAPSDANTPSRLQGAFIKDDEIEKCIQYIKDHNDCDYDSEVEKEIYASEEEQNQTSFTQMGGRSDQLDPLFAQTLLFFIESGYASTSMVQRRFGVGFNRAGKMVDQMEMKGYIGPAEGSKKREVLITMDEFREIFGDV